MPPGKKKPVFSLAIFAAAAAVTLVVVALFRPEESPTRHNLLLLTLDTLRADHLGAYGYPGLISPHLDRFAQQSVVFEHAYTTASFTAPSHASIFTSQHPSTHGILYNGNRQPRRLASRYRTIAEHLQGAGLVTGALVSTGSLYSRYGFSRGFDEYHHLRTKKNRYRGEDGEKDHGCWAKHTTRAAIQFLEQHRHEQFFLWAHYFESHLPYVAPPEIFQELGLPYANVQSKDVERDPERTRNAYRAEVYELDQYVGELLTALDDMGLRDSTVVAVVADHGEYLGEHGLFSHHQLFDEVLHVPLMIQWPELERPSRRTDWVSTIDLAPTLIALLGLPPLPGSAGRDLFAPGAARTVAPNFAEWRDYRLLKAYRKPIEDNFFQVSAQVEHHKLIRSVTAHASQMVFDLLQDPREEENLGRSHPGLSDRLNEILDSHIDSDLPGGLAGTEDIRFDPRTAEMLRDLGYIQDE